MKGFLLRQLGALAAIALVAFALLAQRTLERGEREMLESDRAFHAGQLELAVLHARRAATAYVPGARHVASGHERLRAVARGAEMEGDVVLARSAWGALVAAATQSRHLWQPQPAALAEADSELSRLSAGAAVAPGRAVGLPVPQITGLVLGAAAALLGWGAWRGADGVGQRRPRLGLAALSCFTGLVVWGLALLAG